MYQGQLRDNGGAAQGIYDLRFTIYDSTNLPGTLIAGPYTNNTTTISNGLFTVLIDFGPGVFTGSNYWLEVAVRTNGIGGFTALVPRQPVTPTPYSIYSTTAGNATVAASAGSVSGSVSAGQISGTLAASQLPSSVLTNGSSGVTLGGSFSGNGTGITNVLLGNVNSGGTISVISNSAYAIATTLITSNQPVAMATADLNGDGLVDLIDAHGSVPGYLMVLTNSSGGTFGSNAIYSVNSPGYVLATDLNGDGKPDVVSLSSISSTVTVLTNNGTGRLVSASTNSPGAQPHWVISLDVNNDSKPDLIVANQSSSSITVLTNKGGGVFVTAQTVSSVFSAYTVAAADVNGDGSMDLVTANQSSGIFVLTNNGAGVFGISTNYNSLLPSGGQATCAAITDLNGDGKPDIAVSVNSTAVSPATTLIILTNNGNGIFAPASTPGVGNNAQMVVATDLNNDGKPDLVAPCPSGLANGGGTLSVLYNNGSGMFIPGQTATNGQAVAFVAVADINNDGRPDLLCPQPFSPGKIFIFTNTAAAFQGYAFSGAVIGDGSQLTRLPTTTALLNSSSQTFSGVNSFQGNVGIGAGGSSPAVPLHIRTFGDAEMNLDDGSAGGHRWALVSVGAAVTGPIGSLEIIDRTFNLTRLYIGTNGFVGIGLTNPPSILGVNGTVTASNYVGSGAGLTNLNSSQLTGTIAFARLPGTIVTNGASGISLNGTFGGNGAAMTNVNLYNLNSGGAITALPAWTGTFNLASTPAAPSNPMVVAPTDVNNDGKIDMVIANYPYGLTILTNAGTGEFVFQSTFTVPNGSYAVAAADVNGDGKPEIIDVAYDSPGSLTVLTNDGSGRFAVSTTVTLPDYSSSLAVADFNGDNKVDAVVASAQSSTTVTVLTNNGAGGFVFAHTLAVGVNPGSVTTADVNGDGKADIVAANENSDTLTVLTNDGSGGFALASSPSVGITPFFAAAADVNGDGKVDLMSADWGAGTVTVLTNDGSGNFSMASSTGVGVSPLWIATADINSDGRLDLITADSGSASLTVLTNAGVGNFMFAGSLAAGTYPRSAFAVDINGDGGVDLISVNDIGGTLSIFTNIPTEHTSEFTGLFAGNGGLLTNLAAANLNGTILLSSLPGAVVTNTAAGVTLSGAFNGAFSGNGSSLTNLNATQLTSGTIDLARLPAAVVTNTATGITLGGTFSGNGSGLTNLNAANLTNTVPDARLSANVAFLNGTNVFTTTNRFTGIAIITNNGNLFAGAFAGSGGGLTSLNALSITNALPDARLSTNVALLNGTNIFTATNRFSGPVIATNAANQFTGAFTGNGNTLTNIPFSGLQFLPLTNNQAGVTLTGAFSGTFTGNGNALTNVATGYLTNIVNGVTNVNGTQKIMSWKVPVVVSSPGATLGNAEIDAQVMPPGGTTWTSVADFSVAGGATSVIQTNRSVLSFDVYSGWSYRLTNNITGVGYVAGLDTAKTNQVLFH